MASKRIGILAGGALAGALLLGTAGLVLAQDPTATAAVSPSRGAGMMGGQSGAWMMGGQSGAGMMGGQMRLDTLTPDQLCPRTRTRTRARHAPRRVRDLEHE